MANAPAPPAKASVPIAMELAPLARVPKNSPAPMAILAVPLALTAAPALVPTAMPKDPPADTPSPQATLPATPVEVPPFCGSAPVPLPPQTNWAWAGCARIALSRHAPAATSSAINRLDRITDVDIVSLRPLIKKTKPVRHLGKAAPRAASDVRQVPGMKRRTSNRMSASAALRQHRAGCPFSGLASIAKAGNI